MKTKKTKKEEIVITAENYEAYCAEYMHCGKMEDKWGDRKQAIADAMKEFTKETDVAIGDYTTKYIDVKGAVDYVWLQKENPKVKVDNYRKASYKRQVIGRVKA